MNAETPDVDVGGTDGTDLRINADRLGVEIAFLVRKTRRRLAMISAI
jgi:hypothetical protein